MGICELCDIFHICPKSSPAQKNNDNNNIGNINNINDNNMNQKLISGEDKQFNSKNINKFIPQEKNKINKKHTNKLKSEKAEIIIDGNKKKLINVIFMDKYFFNQQIPITCYQSSIFSKVEEKLYRKHSYLKGISLEEKKEMTNKLINNLLELFPDIFKNNIEDPNTYIGNDHVYFSVNGNLVDKEKTLRENKIKDNTIILINYTDIKKINVNFISSSQKINFKLACYDIFLFSTLEQKLYEQYPELEGKNIIYEVEGKSINVSQSLKKNDIKDDANISMKISDRNIINVKFISVDQKTKISISCYDSDFFVDIEDILYKKAPELKNEYCFLCNGNEVDKYLTFFENNIKDKNIIIIVDVENEEDEEYDDEEYEDEEYEDEEFEEIEDEENEDKDIIKLSKSYLKKNKNLIAVIFRTADQKINYTISCYPDDIFSTVEIKLFLAHPELKYKKMAFICNGRTPNRYATLKENGIKNSSVIMVLELE